MIVRIDCDYLVYKSAVCCEYDVDYGDDLIVVQSRFSEVQSLITNEIKKICATLETKQDDVVLYFSDSKNFRKILYPDYKGHRNRKKPCGYKRAINWLREHYQVVSMPYLEADDALGIDATKDQDNTSIIVSPDKDLRQIPGRLYDFNEVVNVTPEEGTRWHLIQTLAGDQTDGYPGCPGIGVKKAESLFNKYGENWKTVVKAFESAGLTEENALLNARLARILQHTDYDFVANTFIPWSPTTANV
jgi:DNA polymerase-1